jgi:AraC family transcriptional regulator
MLFGAIFDDRTVAVSRGNLQYRENRRWRKSLEAFGKIEWHQRQTDPQCSFLIKRMSWSWFSAELVRIWPNIDAQISNEITISDLAAVAGLSQYHFIRAFKDAVGLPPYQYVLSERIYRARGLLSKPDLSLDDVALAVGFSDASQLNRVFRKFVGVTPTVYRRDADSSFT